jgi:hypothetical protein
MQSIENTTKICFEYCPWKSHVGPYWKLQRTCVGLDLKESKPLRSDPFYFLEL